MDEEQSNHELRGTFGPPPSCRSTTTFSAGVPFPTVFCLYYYHSSTVMADRKEKRFWEKLSELKLVFLYTMSLWSEAAFANHSFLLTQEGSNRYLIAC